MPGTFTTYASTTTKMSTQNSRSSIILMRLSIRIFNGGGKNPEFNEDLIMKINHVDAVLKCEIWMLSRAKNFMDDQLLECALVPIFSISGKGKVI